MEPDSPPPAPPAPAPGGGAGWRAGLCVFSAGLAPWLYGITLVKEHLKLAPYPSPVYSWVQAWYFPLLALGLASWAAALAAAAAGMFRRETRLWIGIPLVLALTAAWTVVLHALVWNNIENVRAGFPFHWPHP